MVPFAFASANSKLGPFGGALFVRGLGLDVAIVPVMTVAYDDIHKDQMPHVSASTRIVQQLGGDFGIALVAVVLTTASPLTHPESGFDAAFWSTIGFTLAASIVALLLPPRERAM